MSNPTTEIPGFDNAKAWLESIMELHARYVAASAYEIGGHDEDPEDITQEACEMALSVEVRSGWYTPGDRNADTKAAEYRILLTTGGPALQITGELSEHGEPEGVPDVPEIQTQDWGTPWTRAPLGVLLGLTFATPEDHAKFDAVEAALSWFVSNFYFGE